MSDLKNKCYEYSGPVLYFQNVADRAYKARTWAPTPRKALSNLTYRFKEDNNYGPSARIILNQEYLKEVK